MRRFRLCLPPGDFAGRSARLRSSAGAGELLLARPDEGVRAYVGCGGAGIVLLRLLQLQATTPRLT
jgi:hypothetical protein